jgi:hypothetical protein
MSQLTGRVKRETEKAVLFNAVGSVKGETWLPKSQIDVVSDSDFDYVFIPDWLLGKKMDQNELRV